MAQAARGARGRAPSPRYRLDVASRAVAGIGGGYALSVLVTLLLARLLPLGAADAGLAATMGSFTIHAIAIIWAFSVRGQARVWGGIAGAAALAGLLLIVIHEIGGGAQMGGGL
ncbi:hypothetical protein KAJ83_15195 [Marivibrio halodurans]|uniref:Iron transporter n=1 Tax=Marivibrio halodurans TaxID=2039722 RepID=A0A8J7SPI0_9PROT|nr:hypothetical protein [Marivibrio halodurans]MBP5858366.1 hypothetical protein [Marivibrio halodurans]